MVPWVVVWQSLEIGCLGMSQERCTPGSEDVDDQSLLALKIHHVGREFSSKTSSVNYGDKIVIAHSSDGGYAEEGWYGNEVGEVNDYKVMAFAAGGTSPSSFYLRPPAGSSISGCIRYGDRVVIASSAQADNSGRCGWYGCNVGKVLHEIVQFASGGDDPESFNVLPGPESSSQLARGDCVSLDDQVAFASSAEYHAGSTDVLFMNGDKEMEYGPAPALIGFYLREPAMGPGNLDLCDDVDTIVTDFANSVIEQINYALIEHADATLSNTTYAWQTSPVTGPLGVTWQNEAGATVTASDFLHATADTDFSVSQCESTGGTSMTFTTAGTVSLTWLGAPTVGLKFFYHGFLPFINLYKKVSLEVQDVSLTVGLRADWTTQAGEATELCLASAEVANCVATGKAKVSGAPSFASNIESKINDAIDDLGGTLCDDINTWLSDFVPHCVRLS